MLIRFKVAGADKAVWINPEHVSGVLASATDVATIYLVGGVEQRVDGHPDEIARMIAEARQSGAGTPALRG